VNQVSDFAGLLRQAAQASTAGSATSVFAEEPVSLTTFVQDKAYLGNRDTPLSQVQYEAVRHIERVYYAETYPALAAEFETGKIGALHVGPVSAWRTEAYWSLPTRMINFATLQWGKGSGKDHVCRISSMRIAYLLMCLESPQAYYGLPAQDTIHLLNVASSSGQAQQAFFMPITRTVKTGWFAGKCQPKQNVISFQKHIEAISGHSDAESQEGLNLMLGIADEIDAFKSKKEMAVRRGASAREPTKSAEGILNMMRTSGSTRFPKVFKQIRISYPRYLGSTIQRLTDEARADVIAQGIDSRHYVSGPLATWEVNPRVTGKEAFTDDYREDPVMARSKYECRPARAINPYFRNHQAIDACFTPVDPLPVEVSYQIETAATSRRRVWVPKYRFADSFYPVRGAVYAMHADMAITADRAGIAMAHVVRYAEHETLAHDEDGASHPIRQLRPHVKVDFVVSYSADASADPAREIQIRWARELCFELTRRGFVIKRFTFDGFQSTDSMQILTAKGIDSERVSTDLHEDPWRNLRDLAYEGRLVIPGPVPPEDPTQPAEPFLLREELLSLTRLPNGHIDHPSDGCFVGETRIPLLDGTLPQIQELEGQAVWVYSARPDGRIVPGWARARRTKVAKRLVDVVLDSGYTARCTPEHLWMQRDGSYKPAQDLIPGVDRLMPITRSWPVNGGYERVSDKDGRRTLTHTLVAEHILGRRLAADELAHHDNEVKTDNRPENLVVMNRDAHRLHHASQRWARDAAYVQAVRDGHARWRGTTAAAQALAGRDLSARWAHLATAEQRHAEMARILPFYRHDITVETLRTVLSEDNANAAARALGCGRNVVISRLRQAGYTSWAQFQTAVDANHKVRAVIAVELDHPVPVYDLEVDQWHNFALPGGVFVHNSKDEADALACAVLGAVQLGGTEEAGGAPTSYAPPQITVGRMFDLPIGVNPAGLWERELPSLY